MNEDKGMGALEFARGAMESLSAKSLDRILKNTVSTIETNKTQIFDIYEAARAEVETSRQTLEDLRELTRQTIKKVDELSEREQQEKRKLAETSGDFANYSEEIIRGHYETVKDIQIELSVAREKENQLRAQRDALELRLHGLKEILRTAEHLAICIGSVLSYLSDQINGVVWQIEEAQKSKFIGAKIIKAQEEERLRVSRELHDGPAQEIANLIFQASIIERMVDRDPDEAKRGLQELRGHIRACLSDMRQIIFDMRPMSLDDLGLEPAIRQLISKMRERGMLDASLSVEGEEQKLAKYAEVSVFRIIQESLNNVSRHAGVKKAEVRMLYTASALAVTVRDEGKGFDPEAEPEFEAPEEEDFSDERDVNDAASRNSYGQYGLLGMRERAAIIGAEFNVLSEPGKGTCIHLRLPFRPNVLAAERDQGR